MKIDFKKDLLPHLIAIAVFLVVTVAFFSPVFFQNQSLAQHDIQQWQGSAQELIDYRESTGREGLWTNSMFGGMPAYLINTIWDDKPIELLHRAFTLGLPHPVLVVFASFLSFYILLLVFKVRPYISIGMALAFGLSSYMIVGLVAGHNARIGAIAYFPLVVAGVHLAFSGKRWLGLGVTTAALAMQLRVNHLQITYYLLLTLAVYGVVFLVKSWKEGTLRPFFTTLAILVVGALMAVASMIGKFWSTYEYGKYSMRGQSELASTEEGDAAGLAKWYAFQYSNSIFEPMVLIIPDFMGGSSSTLLISDEDSETLDALRRSGDQQTANQLARFSRAYWGKQGGTAPYYAGAIVGFLFVLGILLVDTPVRNWLLIVFGLGIVLSWGSNFSSFNYLMFDYFPMYNKFRSVTFTIMLSIFSMILMAGIGLEKFVNSPAEAKKKLLMAFGIFGGLCLLLIVGAGMINMRGPSDISSQLPVWFTSALQDDRAGLLRADAFRTLIFSGLAFGVLWFLMMGKVKPTLAVVLISGLVLADSWSVDTRYISKDNFERNPSQAFFTKTEIDNAILEDTEPGYRVYNLQGAMSEARTSYYHHSIGGYHGAKMRRYQDLYENQIEPETQELITKLQNGDQNYSELGVINMLNTKYFYVGSSVTGVFRNPNPNGAAWFVEKVQKVNSPDEELDTVGEIDTKKEAVIDQSKFQSKDSYSVGSITLTSWTPDKVTYEANVAGEGMAIFSEIYYPKGWTATIDGTETPILRANYVLRALEVPAGNHTIEFEFKPAAYVIGNKITLAFNILVILVLIGGIYLEVRMSNQAPEGV